MDVYQGLSETAPSHSPAPRSQADLPFPTEPVDHPRPPESVRSLSPPFPARAIARRSTIPDMGRDPVPTWRPNSTGISTSTSSPSLPTRSTARRPHLPANPPRPPPPPPGTSTTSTRIPATRDVRRGLRPVRQPLATGYDEPRISCSPSCRMLSCSRRETLQVICRQLGRWIGIASSAVLIIVVVFGSVRGAVDCR